MISALFDILQALLFDADRELSRAAKRWVEACRNRCDGDCECCHALIAIAWDDCQRWRRAQQAGRFNASVMASTVFATWRARCR